MTLTLKKLPSSWSLYLGAAGTARRKPQGKIEIPALEARMDSVMADAKQLAGYNEVCGFKKSEHLPITFPQVMVTGLHMVLMSQPQFPLPMLGLVHLRNSITQQRPLRVDESYGVLVRLGESREIRAGLEFDLITEFTLGEDTLYRAVTTILHRVSAPKTGNKSKPRPETPDAVLSDYRSFDAPADIGRRYASVGKDYNPIHLSAASAKLFGFPRAIAHGMWSLARCAALTQDNLQAEPKELQVQFKQPLLLPGKVAVKFNASAEGINFALLARNGNKTHLTGSLR
jgi:hypothetical protein